MNAFGRLVLATTALVMVGVALPPAHAEPPGDAPTKAAATPAKPLDLDGLFARFARMPGLEAGFVEEKRLQLLAQPLVNKGRLYFMRPGYLARHVTSPSAGKVVITPTVLRFEDKDGSGTVDLSARPDVKLFVESIARILAGDKAGLEAVYRITFTAARDGKPWRMELTPRGGAIAKLVRFLRFTGHGPRVAEIRIAETSGDETVTRILDADPARTFTAEEQATLFGLPPKPK